VNRRLSNMVAAMPGFVIAVHADMHITEINSTALQTLGFGEADIIDQPISRIWPHGLDRLMEFCLGEGDIRSVSHRTEEIWLRSDGQAIPVLVSTAVLQPETGMGQMGFLCVGLDLRERRALEIQLRHAQKMESVGQLAAGIAHEINTPLQYLSDNVHFIQDAFDAILEIQPAVEQLKKTCIDAGMREQVGAVIAAEAVADITYLQEQVPLAIHRSLEGIDRVSSIVAAVKTFSRTHQDQGAMDLNGVIQNTLEVARNEYKYVADIESHFGEIPMVMGNAGEIGQVVLNLVVNAAHAIADRFGDGGPRGKIHIETSTQGKSVRVAVRDNGNGIPHEIRHRIFDPFFTTKEVGRGTGQGLTIVHSLVVDKHAGSVGFESVPGEGTVFHIDLPIDGKPQAKSR
jgi:two-component system, NtrC family, sensor kinase